MKTPEEGLRGEEGVPVMAKWGLATGWSPIFTTGLTIMTYNRVAFSTELLLDFLKVLRFSFPVPVT